MRGASREGCALPEPAEPAPSPDPEAEGPSSPIFALQSDAEPSLLSSSRGVASSKVAPRPWPSSLEASGALGGGMSPIPVLRESEEGLRSDGLAASVCRRKFRSRLRFSPKLSTV